MDQFSPLAIEGLALEMIVSGARSQQEPTTSATTSRSAPMGVF
jgi:hypothetical protein